MSDHTATTISLPYQTFREMERELEALRRDLATRPVASASASHIEATLRDAVARALPIVQFAVANLPPHSIRGWPSQDLRAFAEQLRIIAAGTPDNESLVITLKGFADEIDEIDTIRRDRLAWAERVLKTHPGNAETELTPQDPIDEPDPPT